MFALINLGLENAEIVRYGQMHRNTYWFQLLKHPARMVGRTVFCKITGVEDTR
jgi:folate-dependent tRNA-U54 methylase TrmFO/GidA